MATLFSNTFATGTLTGWTSATTGSGVLNVAAAAAKDDGFGLEATLNETSDSTGRAEVAATFSASTTNITVAQCWFRRTSYTQAGYGAGQSKAVLRLGSDGATGTFDGTQRGAALALASNGDVQITYRSRNGTDTVAASTAWAPPLNTWLALRLQIDRTGADVIVTWWSSPDATTWTQRGTVTDTTTGTGGVGATINQVTAGIVNNGQFEKGQYTHQIDAVEVRDVLNPPPPPPPLSAGWARATGAPGLARVSRATLNDLSTIGSIARDAWFFIPPPLGSLTPDPALLTLTAIDPGVVISGGDLVITPDPVLFTAAALDPVAIAGALTLAPLPAPLTLTALDPTPTLGSMVLTPDVAAVVLAALDPVVALDNVTVTPDAAAVALAALDPAVILGAVLVVPDPASVAMSAADPAVSLDALLIVPDAAALALTALDPFVQAGGDIAVTPDPALLALVTLDPAAILGALAVTPDPALLDLAALDPAVDLGAISITPPAAAAALTAHEPLTIAGSLVLTPDAALFVVEGINPVVLIVGGVVVIPTRRIYRAEPQRRRYSAEPQRRTYKAEPQQRVYRARATNGGVSMTEVPEGSRKDPNDISDWTTTWDDVPTGATITAVACTIVAGSATIAGAPTISGKYTIVRITGGTEGEIVEIQSRISTSTGEQFDDTMFLPVGRR